MMHITAVSRAAPMDWRIHSSSLSLPVNSSCFDNSTGRPRNGTESVWKAKMKKEREAVEH